MLPKERKTIRKESGVPPTHSLHTHTRRAKRRRGSLDAHPAHFVEHHDDVAGRHEHLLLDLFTLEHLDAQGRILDARIRAGSVHRDLFFDLFLRLQLDTDEPCLGLVDINRRVGREEAVLRDRDLERAKRDGRGGDPVLSRLHGLPVELNGSSRHRRVLSGDLDANSRRHLLREDTEAREEEE